MKGPFDHTPLSCAPVLATVAFVLLSGCHSYSTITRADLEDHLSAKDVETFQVIDSACREYRGETWSLTEDAIILGDESIPTDEIELVRTKSRLKRPLSISAMAGLPTGIFLAAMSREDGVASMAGGFAIGFLPVALPMLLALKAQDYHVVTWVQDPQDFSRTIDKSEFPCRN